MNSRIFIPSNWLNRVPIAAFTLYALLSLPVLAYQQGTVNDGAVIKGRVIYSSGVPMKKVIPSNPEVCGKPHDIPLIETSENGGVTDAVVYLDKVKSGKAWPKRGAPPRLDNVECRFRPQLIAMQPGPLIIVNSDPVLHNTHAFYGRRTALNIALPKKGLEIERELTRPGIVRVECDEHGHMSARVLVAANPYYAATANAGRFNIDQVPPGEYTLIVYQEETGPIETRITLKKGETRELNIDLAKGTFQ